MKANSYRFIILAAEPISQLVRIVTQTHTLTCTRTHMYTQTTDQQR